MPEDAELRQVVVPRTLWPALESWLGARGLILARIPDIAEGAEDDLPTYVIHPRS